MEEYVDVDVQMERPFIWEGESGFIWHKNCIIPELNLAIDESHYEQLLGCEDVGKLYCEVTSACTVRKADYFLHSIPLEGESVKEFTGNKMRFSNLKFTETSFNCQVWFVVNHPIEKQIQLDYMGFRRK